MIESIIPTTPALPSVWPNADLLVPIYRLMKSHTFFRLFISIESPSGVPVPCKEVYFTARGSIFAPIYDERIRLV